MGGDNELVSAALAYARRGWQVFPCHSRHPLGGCSCVRVDCSSPAKHPRVAGGLKAATCDEKTIRAWWRRWPGANVAIRTGAESNLVVIDVDPAHGGRESMAALVAGKARLPAGPVVDTGGRGWHLYLAHPGRPVRNDAGRRLGPGVDLRGDGGYVIAPPSRHASGARYTGVGMADDVAAMPAWLLVRLAQPERPRPAPFPGQTDACSAWADTALRAEVATVAGARQGGRNHALNRAAFNLGQIVAGGGLAADVVVEALVAAAAGAGLGEREARATVASGLGAGTRLPRAASAARKGPEPAGASW